MTFVTQATRDTIADSLLEVADVYTRALVETQEITPDCRFALIARDQAKLARDTISPQVLDNAISSARMSLVSLADALRAFAYSLRAPSPMGPALGMLTRGMVESGARACWIAQATTQDDLLRRWMQIRILNQSYLVTQHPVPENKDLLERLKRVAASLGIEGKDSTVRYGTLSIDLLSRFVRAPLRPSSEYSFLSAMTHGDAVSHEYSTQRLDLPKTNRGLDATIVGLTEAVLSHLIFLITGTLFTTIQLFCSWFGEVRDTLRELESRLSKAALLISQ